MYGVKWRSIEITTLTGSTPVLGSTALEWHKALTGSFEKSLAEVKRRVDELAAGSHKLKPPEFSSDVASSLRKK